MVWKKGQSGNPKGRKRGGDSLAEAIRSSVDPDELIEAALRIVRQGSSEASRMAAINFLAERGWKKPAQQLEVSRGDSPLSELTDDELRALKAETLRRLGQGDGDAQGGAQSVIDITPTEGEGT